MPVYLRVSLNPKAEIYVLYSAVCRWVPGAGLGYGGVDFGPEGGPGRGLLLLVAEL